MNGHGRNGDHGSRTETRNISQAAPNQPSSSTPEPAAGIGLPRIPSDNELEGFTDRQVEVGHAQEGLQDHSCEIAAPWQGLERREGQKNRRVWVVPERRMGAEEMLGEGLLPIESAFLTPEGSR